MKPFEIRREKKEVVSAAVGVDGDVVSATLKGEVGHPNDIRIEMRRPFDGDEAFVSVCSVRLLRQLAAAALAIADAIEPLDEPDHQGLPREPIFEENDQFPGFKSHDFFAYKEQFFDTSNGGFTNATEDDIEEAFFLYWLENRVSDEEMLLHVCSFENHSWDDVTSKSVPTGEHRLRASIPQTNHYFVWDIDDEKTDRLAATWDLGDIALIVTDFKHEARKKFVDKRWPSNRPVPKVGQEWLS